MCIEIELRNYNFSIITLYSHRHSLSKPCWRLNVCTVPQIIVVHNRHRCMIQCCGCRQHRRSSNYWCRWRLHWSRDWYWLHIILNIRRVVGNRSRRRVRYELIGTCRQIRASPSLQTVNVNSLGCAGFFSYPKVLHRQHVLAQCTGLSKVDGTWKSYLV